MNKYILVTGGELFNKGAQSMTFITINELVKRFPNKKVILLSSADYERKEEDKNQYKFEILPISLGLVLELMGGFYKLIWNLKAKKENRHKYKDILANFNNILNDTDAIIDISGYALSSQWGIKNSLYYLARVMLAKKYGINLYVMPQSFGPFSYKKVYKPIMNYLIKRYMEYPIVVYAREKEGYDLLRNKYKLNNVKKSYDLVLMNKEINVSNIYEDNPSVREYENAKGIAIIPNMRNFDHGNFDKIISLYNIIIKKLINAGKEVYLVRHSYEDIEACKIIKERFTDFDSVVLLDDDMSCIEFDKLVKKFEFIIASRFHSIVHAYKNGVPCVALGWATKYHELLKIFKQENYIFDVRKDIDVFQVEKAIDMLLEKHIEESKVILSRLDEIQTCNVFDVMEEDIK